MLLGPSAFPTKDILPPHVEELGRSLGVSQFFLGAEMPAGGLNLAQEWYNRCKNYYKIQHGLIEKNATQLADVDLKDVINTVKGLSPEMKEYVFNKVKGGESFVFVHPKTTTKGTSIHEVMHTLTGKELGEELSGQVGMGEIGQLVNDSKESGVRDVSYLASNDLAWLSRRQEYFTELMTQYFLKNLKEGSKSFRLAEAILRTSKDPKIQQLIGTSLQAVISFQLAKKLQKKRKD